MTTRTGRGRVAPPRSGGPGDGGGQRRIAGEDLAPVKARVLLMLALGEARDTADLQRIFREYRQGKDGGPDGRTVSGVAVRYAREY